MATKILSAELRPGMTVSSQRTKTRVYRLTDVWTGITSFPMKGKAIVLNELSTVKLKYDKMVWNEKLQKYYKKPAVFKKNAVVLLHYNYGPVMYFVNRPLTDAKWYLRPDKEVNSE